MQIYRQNSGVLQGEGGLRTRFRPRSRIGQGLITAAPWVDIVLLVIAFVLLDSRFVLQPGLVIELPGAAFRGGMRSGLVAVVLSVEQPGEESRREIIFFDDQRYFVQQEAHMAKLKEVFANACYADNTVGLTIQADSAVRHGTVVRLCTMADDVGILRVNVATRPFNRDGFR